VANWQSIRDNAYQIVLLSQRGDDLWSYPARAEEDIHAPVGSKEREIRTLSEFGHSSITVSYNALTALELAAPGEVLGLAAAADRALREYRDDGAYGSPTKGKGEARSVNVLPRHTAAAALLLLSFKPNRSADELRRHLRPTIDWLVQHKRPGGGWSYDHKKTGTEAGFMTTACAVAAIGAFLELEPDAALMSEASGVAEPALSSLTAQMKNGAWTGDGGSINSASVDSAFALVMLMNQGALALLGSGRDRLQALLSAFFAAATPTGFARRPEEKSAAAAPTVAGLLTLARARDAGFQTPELDAALDALVLAAWDDGSLAATFESWDWQNLLMLAALRAGPLANGRRLELDAKCAGLIARRKARKLTTQDLAGFEPPIQRAAEYVLARGGKLERPRAAFWSKLSEIPWDFLKNALWAGLVALITLVISWFAGWLG
jgi:hypothetical protein